MSLEKGSAMTNPFRSVPLNNGQSCVCLRKILLRGRKGNCDVTAKSLHRFVVGIKCVGARKAPPHTRQPRGLGYASFLATPSLRTPPFVPRPPPLCASNPDRIELTAGAQHGHPSA